MVREEREEIEEIEIGMSRKNKENLRIKEER